MLYLPISDKLEFEELDEGYYGNKILDFPLLGFLDFTLLTCCLFFLFLSNVVSISEISDVTMYNFNFLFASWNETSIKNENLL